MSNIILTEIGGQWSFSSEAQLEDFVWSSLEKIFNIIPLKRQFGINNQICDILALNQEKQLTIIELKNGEDRYLVNQLTRYYDALITQKPLSDEIDYAKPIQLIAISPGACQVCKVS